MISNKSSPADADIGMIKYIEKISSYRKMDYLRNNSKKRIERLMQNLSCEQDHKHTLVILDMDGTIYPLDGENAGFKNSSKERHLTESFVDFIQSHEPDLSREQALSIFQTSLLDKIGPSVFFAHRYSLNRADIFSAIWNKLNPNVIVGQANSDVERTLMNIRQEACILLLLTAAPAIWQKTVFDHLHISNLEFDDVMTTEDFLTKEDFFSQLALASGDLHVTSVGDTAHSDIEPAQKMGFSTIHINGHTSFEEVPELLSHQHS